MEGRSTKVRPGMGKKNTVANVYSGLLTDNNL